MVDINADDWLDLYVSASFLENPALKKNLLYIKQGTDEAGVPTFVESAQAYGLADAGFSTQGYFFDYDRDGDTDYVAGNLRLNSNFQASPDEPMMILAKGRDQNGRIDPIDKNMQRITITDFLGNPRAVTTELAPRNSIAATSLKQKYFF